MSKSKIEWTDRSWNPVTGCTKISPGCKNCYAERMYERFHGHGSFKNVICHENRLLQPMNWRKPSLVFVNSMSDLFHEDVPFQFIIDVFLVMSKCRHHTFQILTKRPERMLEFMTECNYNPYGTPYTPLPNVWLGVSVEDQKAAEERIPLLLQVPASVRFLSCEPLLGPLDISSWFYPKEYIGMEVNNWEETEHSLLKQDIHWVICGGESGPGARPMHADWTRSLRDQCAAAGVPFFFKQWGEWLPGTESGEMVIKVGKKKAGYLLDGKQHLEFPKSINQPA